MRTLFYENAYFSILFNIENIKNRLNIITKDCYINLDKKMGYLRTFYFHG